MRNAEAPWGTFDSYEYWRSSYTRVLPEDRGIIDLVSRFFISALAGRGQAGHAIDVGSGSNLYPALLMLPWTSQILLTDYSANNVAWLHQNVVIIDDASWPWQPFWDELAPRNDYSQIGEPRKQLRQACSGEPRQAGIEQRSVFDLPSAQWDLGTMFFVAESMTEDVAEFRAALKCFARALRPGAPFAVAFMAGSTGYAVAGVNYPALPVYTDDIAEQFIRLGVSDLRVRQIQTGDRVRPGYAGMIVATGFAEVC